MERSATWNPSVNSEFSHLPDITQQQGIYSNNYSSGFSDGQQTSSPTDKDVESYEHSQDTTGPPSGRLRRRPPKSSRVTNSARRDKDTASHKPPVKRQKRSKNANYTDAEIFCLLEQTALFSDVLLANRSVATEVAAKQECWDKVAQEVNRCSDFAVQRTGWEVRKKFSKVKMSVVGFLRGEPYGKVDNKTIRQMLDIIKTTDPETAASLEADGVDLNKSDYDIEPIPKAAAKDDQPVEKFTEVSKHSNTSKAVLKHAKQVLKQANRTSKTVLKQADSNKSVVDQKDGQRSKPDVVNSRDARKVSLLPSEHQQPLAVEVNLSVKNEEEEDLYGGETDDAEQSFSDSDYSPPKPSAPKTRQKTTPQTRQSLRISHSPKRFAAVKTSFGNSKKRKTGRTYPNRSINFSASEIETLMDAYESNREEFDATGLFVRRRNFTSEKFKAWQMIADRVNKLHSHESGVMRRAKEVRKKMFKLRSEANKAKESIEAALNQGRRPPVVGKIVERMMQIMNNELAPLNCKEVSEDDRLAAEMDAGNESPDTRDEVLGVRKRFVGTGHRTKPLVKKYLDMLTQTCQRLRRLGVDASAVILDTDSVMTCGSDRVTVMPPESLPLSSVTVKVKKHPVCVRKIEPQVLNSRWNVTTFDSTSKRPSTRHKVKAKRTNVPQNNQSKLTTANSLDQITRDADARNADARNSDAKNSDAKNSESLHDFSLKKEVVSDDDGDDDDGDDDGDGGDDDEDGDEGGESGSEELNVTFACSESGGSDRMSEKDHSTSDVTQDQEEQEEKPESRAQRGVATYNCLLCIKTFTTTMGLSIHSRRVHKMHRKQQHLVEPPEVLTAPVSSRVGFFKCELCHKSFTWKKSLKQHMFVHDDVKRFQCEVCGRKFTYKYNMDLHMRTHTGHKPSKCPYCDQAFPMSSTLTVHIRRHHTGERPYLCDLCGQSFFTKTIMASHRRTHTGETPFKCADCSESFMQRSALMFHRRLHTNDQPNVCKYCSKAFRTAYKLKVHLRMHTGEKPYTCEVCLERFARSDTMKQHIKNRHADVMAHLFKSENARIPNAAPADSDTTYSMDAGLQVPTSASVDSDVGYSMDPNLKIPPGVDSDVGYSMDPNLKIPPGVDSESGYHMDQSLKIPPGVNSDASYSMGAGLKIPCGVESESGYHMDPNLRIPNSTSLADGGYPMNAGTATPVPSDGSFVMDSRGMNATPVPSDGSFVMDARGMNTTPAPSDGSIVTYHHPPFCSRHGDFPR